MKSKTALIAVREYVYNFRRPMYLFTAFILPLIILVVMYFVFSLLLDSENDLSEYQQVGYVDLTPEQFLARIREPDKRFVRFVDETRARAALDEETIGAYFVVAADYIATGRLDFYSMKSPPLALQQKVDAFIVEGLIMLAPPDTPVERLQEPLNLNKLRILGENTEFSDPADLLAPFIMPIIFAMLLFITLNTTAQFLMGGVVEEKENRMMEILVTSCTPAELLWGKVLGLGAISLTQVATWGSGMYLMARTRGEVGDFFADAGVGADDILFFVGLFVITYFQYAAIALGVGAAASAEQEARQFSSIFSLITIAPMIFIGAYFSSSSVLPVMLSLFPLTAPLSLLLGRSFGSLPTWVMPVSLGILVLSVFLTMWVATRVFRLGMLRYGQRLTTRQIARALLRRQSQVVVVQPREQ